MIAGRDEDEDEDEEEGGREGSWGEKTGLRWTRQEKEGKEVTAIPSLSFQYVSPFICLEVLVDLAVTQ